MRFARTISITSVLLLIIIGTVIPAKKLMAAIATEDDLPRVTANLPFTMKPIELPKIPARSVTVSDFGAVGDGVFLNTTAFAAAIEACERIGGGRVVVPQGIWRAGPIQLKSSIDLESRKQ